MEVLDGSQLLFPLTPMSKLIRFWLNSFGEAPSDD
jgi:hypothetical protein